MLAHEVGLIRHADGYDAVISSAGKDFTVRNAYFRPEQLDRFGHFVGVEGRGPPTGNVIGVRIHGDAHLQVRYSANHDYTVRLKAGFTGSPYIGLAIERELW